MIFGVTFLLLLIFAAGIPIGIYIKNHQSNTPTPVNPNSNIGNGGT